VNEPIRTTLADLASWLAGEGITFALIGGLAVSVRGEPRLTVDIDATIAGDVEVGLRLARQLTSSPFEPLFDGVEEVVATAFILPIRHRATAVKVDLALGLTGFEQGALERSRMEQVAGTLVPVVSAEDLLLMKALAGRPRDLEDLRGILIRQGEKMDLNRARTLARELDEAVGSDVLARLDASIDEVRKR
jgi:hypothetical protein